MARLINNRALDGTLSCLCTTCSVARQLAAAVMNHGTSWRYLAAGRLQAMLHAGFQNQHPQRWPPRLETLAPKMISIYMLRISFQDSLVRTSVDSLGSLNGTLSVRVERNAKGTIQKKQYYTTLIRILVLKILILIQIRILKFLSISTQSLL